MSLFYSWLKKEEESVKAKEISVGDVEAIAKAIKEAEVDNGIPATDCFNLHNNRPSAFNRPRAMS